MLQYVRNRMKKLAKGGYSTFLSQLYRRKFRILAKLCVIKIKVLERAIPPNYQFYVMMDVQVHFFFRSSHPSALRSPLWQFFFSIFLLVDIMRACIHQFSFSILSFFGAFFTVATCNVQEPNSEEGTKIQAVSELLFGGGGLPKN